MLIKALLAYAHYFSFIAMIMCIVVEKASFRKVMSTNRAKIIARADLFYGITALLVLLTGFLRIFNEKGLTYYFGNYIFIIKLVLFTLIGLLSIYPTLIFVKWRKQLKNGGGIEMENGKYQMISNILTVELVLAFMIPLFAALLARGFGF